MMVSLALYALTLAAPAGPGPVFHVVNQGRRTFVVTAERSAGGKVAPQGPTLVLSPKADLNWKPHGPAPVGKKPAKWTLILSDHGQKEAGRIDLGDQVLRAATPAQVAVFDDSMIVRVGSRRLRVILRPAHR